MTRRYLMAGVAAFVIVVVFFLFLLKPKLGQISDTREQVQKEQETKQSLQTRLRQLQAAEKTAPDTMAQLAKFDRLLPATPDLPTLIRQLQDAATASGINLISIAPGQPAALSGATAIKAITTTLQVTGGFFRMESFLTRLEDLQRVAEVTALSISPSVDAATGLQSLSSTVTLRLYVVEPGAKLTGGTTTSGRATASPTPTARAT